MSEEKSKSWLDWLSHILLREPKDMQQLTDVLRDAAERDLLSTEMLAMIESVLQVAEMQVREIMVPKTQMITLDENSTLEAILPWVIQSGHSRFPVVEQGGEDVVGILLAKDLVKYCFSHTNTTFQLKNIMRPVVFVPQSKRLNVLLREFRINHQHMAVVIDEYGHVAGLVTIEDVLEQIVGDIADEYDIEEDEFIKQHADNSYAVKAGMPIEDFNEYFQTNFSDDEFDTIGGIIAKNFAHLPKRGESIKINGFKFKVLHSDNRRIHLVEVRRE